MSDQGFVNLVQADGGDGDGIKYARTVEERFAWLKLVRKGKLSAGALKLAMLLFDSCNSVTGQCNPSRSTIERQCAMTNALRAIHQLRDAGLIEVEPGHQKSNQYFLILRSDNNFQPGSELNQGGIRTDPGGGSELIHDPGSELNPKPVVNLESEHLSEPESESGPSVEADLANTTAANDVLELIRSGVAAGVSFGFILPPQRRSPNAMKMEREPFELGDVRFDPEPDVPGADVRVIRDLILFEISLGVARPVFKQNTARVREQCITQIKRAIWLP